MCSGLRRIVAFDKGIASRVAWRRDSRLEPWCMFYTLHLTLHVKYASSSSVSGAHRGRSRLQCRGSRTSCSNVIHETAERHDTHPLPLQGTTADALCEFRQSPAGVRYLVVQHVRIDAWCSRRWLRGTWGAGNRVGVRMMVGGT